MKFFWSGFGVADSDEVAAEIAQHIAEKEVLHLKWFLNSKKMHILNHVYGLYQLHPNVNNFGKINLVNMQRQLRLYN